MTVVAPPARSDAPRRDVTPPLGLFQVWINIAPCESEPEWWWNSPPKPLGGALDEARAARQEGWAAIVLPEGSNPRADGRWDNPI